MRRAEELDPSNPYITGTIADSLRCLKDYGNASLYYEKTIENLRSNSNSTETHEYYHIALLNLIVIYDRYRLSEKVKALSAKFVEGYGKDDDNMKFVKYAMNKYTNKVDSKGNTDSIKRDR